MMLVARSRCLCDRTVNKQQNRYPMNMLNVPDARDRARDFRDVLSTLPEQVINKQQDRQFSRADIRMVKAFAPQISIAIENSKLFVETEKALNHAILEVCKWIVYFNILGGAVF